MKDGKNESASAIHLQRKNIWDGGFYSPLSKRVERKYHTERYPTIFTDINESQHDLTRYFIATDRESKFYKNLEIHWIIQSIICMCSELSNFQEGLTSHERKVLIDNPLFYYKWYVAPMVLPLAAMCMLGYLDQTLENDRCMPAEKSHLESGYRFHQIGDYARQIDNLYMLFNELQYNFAEMIRECPGVNLFDRDGRLKELSDGFGQLHRAIKFSERADSIASKALVLAVIIGFTALFLFIASSTFGAGAAPILMSIVYGIACVGLPACFSVFTLGIFASKAARSKETEKFQTLCKIKPYTQPNETNDVSIQIRARYLNEIWDGLRELNIHPYKDSSHDWNKNPTCKLRILAINDDISKIVGEGYFLKFVKKERRLCLMLYYRDHPSRDFIVESEIHDHIAFFKYIHDTKILLEDPNSKDTYTILPEKLEDFIKLNGGHAPFTGRSIESVVGAAFRVAVRYFNQAMDLAQKHNFPELQKAIKAYQNIIDSLGYNEQRTVHLIEIAHDVRELVLRKVSLRDQAMNDPDTQKYIDKLRKHNNALDEKLKKRVEKMENFIKKLDFASLNEDLSNEASASHMTLAP